VPNEVVIELIHALRAAPKPTEWQVAALSWAGLDTLGARLGTLQQSAGYTLEQFGIRGAPAFACAGSRAGLMAFAALVVGALGTTAVVLNRGKEVH
jgi:hypothetical protein